MYRRQICLCLAVPILTGLILSPATGAVVALKDYATVAAGGTLDSAFTGAINDQTMQVYTNSTADTMLSQYGSGSGTFWSNYGTATKNTHISNVTYTSLVQFDLDQLPGFAPGAVITKAQLRMRIAAGNTGSYNPLRYVVTQDWAEGNKNSAYPGTTTQAPAAEGASNAHPKGLNTGANQKADGTAGTSTSGSWGVNGDTQWDPAVDSAVVPNVAVTKSSSFLVWTVTDIVQSWAEETVANRGFVLPRSNTNYTVYFSEYGATTANYEPVLFIDYTPVPEPATLALLALSSLMFVRRKA